MRDRGGLTGGSAGRGRGAFTRGRRVQRSPIRGKEGEKVGELVKKQRNGKRKLIE